MSASLLVDCRNCICLYCTSRNKVAKSKIKYWRGDIQKMKYIFSEYSGHSHQGCAQTPRKNCWTLLIQPLLLIIAGDVELNPGPSNEFSLKELLEELDEVTKPLIFGAYLGIPKKHLDTIQANVSNGI